MKKTQNKAVVKPAPEKPKKSEKTTVKDKAKVKAKKAYEADLARLSEGYDARARAGNAARKLATAGGYDLGFSKEARENNKGKKSPRDYYARKGR